MNHVLIGDCRTMLQRLIDEGYDAVQVMQFSRHSDPRMLERYYHGNKLRDIVNNRGKVVELRKEGKG